MRSLTDAERAERERLRREIHRAYQQEVRPTARINDAAAAIAELNNKECEHEEKMG